MMDLSEPLRTAIIGNAAITGILSIYAGAPAAFTRAPLPADALYPLIVISPDIVFSDVDGLTARRNNVVRDISVYGQNDTPQHYRAVETLAYLVRDLFHRQNQSISIAGFRVIDIVAAGPIPAPVDDDQDVGRLVTLTIRAEPTS